MPRGSRWRWRRRWPTASRVPTSAAVPGRARSARPCLPGSDAASPLELAVVLPTYNERLNIAPMVARIEQALGPSGWEAIFVDDDSTDGTADEARRIAAADPRIRAIQRFGRRGLASAAIEGMCAT